MVVPASKPVDLDHLNGYTGGDRALNHQILGLFDGQCHEIIEKLTDLAQAGEAKSWSVLLHALEVGESRLFPATSAARSEQHRLLRR